MEPLLCLAGSPLHSPSSRWHWGHSAGARQEWAQENSYPDTQNIYFSFQISTDLETHEQLLKLLQGRLQGNINQVLTWPSWTVWVLGNPPPLSSRVGHAELDRLCLIGKKIEKRKSKNIFTRANTTAPTEPLAIFLTLSSSRCSWSHVPSESLVCWTWSYCWGPGLLCCSANPPFTSVLCSTVGQWHGKSTQGLCPRSFDTCFLSSADPELQNWVMAAPLSQEKLDCLRFSQLDYNSSVLPGFTVLFCSLEKLLGNLRSCQ